MKLKAVFMLVILTAACLFSSCGDNRIPAENNFSRMFSEESGYPVYVGLTLDDTAAYASRSAAGIDGLVSAIASADLAERPDPDDLPDPDSMLLQIEILRNGSAESQGMDFCFMNFYRDGTLSVFGSEQFAGSGKSYSLSKQDLKKIEAAAEKVTAGRTSCPPPMRITDPLSSYSHSGAIIGTAGISWDYTDPDDPDMHNTIEADALHPLDELASPVKINRLYSTSVLLDFPAGFEPDKIKITGWDISQKGDTSSETINNPKTEYENNFPGSGDYTGFFQLESNTVYYVTVTYDSTKYAERGFTGTADYYFETGDLN